MLLKQAAASASQLEDGGAARRREHGSKKARQDRASKSGALFIIRASIHVEHRQRAAQRQVRLLKGVCRGWWPLFG